jgi:hypothetical protein
MKNTQVEKVIRLMARRHTQEWFNAIDFQKSGLEPDVFVGYEATARISDVMRQFPTLVDVKRDGKYRYIKLNPIKQIIADPAIPGYIKEIIKAEAPAPTTYYQSPLFKMEPPERKRYML